MNNSRARRWILAVLLIAASTILTLFSARLWEHAIVHHEYMGAVGSMCITIPVLLATGSYFVMRAFDGTPELVEVEVQPEYQDA